MGKIRKISFLKPEEHPKAWGKEVWYVNNDKYCLKYLFFEKNRAKFSLHYHWDKEETWYVLYGSFKLTYINLETAERMYETIKTGDIIHIPPGNPDQLESLEEESAIIEVSTPHYEHDSYRIEKGDNQK